LRTLKVCTGPFTKEENLATEVKMRAYKNGHSRGPGTKVKK